MKSRCFRENRRRSSARVADRIIEMRLQEEAMRRRRGLALPLPQQKGGVR